MFAVEQSKIIALEQKDTSLDSTVQYSDKTGKGSTTFILLNVTQITHLLLTHWISNQVCFTVLFLNGVIIWVPKAPPRMHSEAIRSHSKKE